MKTTYVKDLHNGDKINHDVQLFGWIFSRREQGRIIFLSVGDSTGVIQTTVEKTKLTADEFENIGRIPVDASVSVEGTLVSNGRGGVEISASKITMIGGVDKRFTPPPRSHFKIFSPSFADHVLTHRHMYIRNPQIMAILEFRDCLLFSIRKWFKDNGFVSIDAPILTPVPLYEDETAIGLTINDEEVFLTQCVGYYLEAAVHAFERVYNIGPSFRGEESHSKRHLMEYWHIKAEIAWGNLEDIMTIVEDVFHTVTRSCAAELEKACDVLGTKPCADGGIVPFARITYREAVQRLQAAGHHISFGRSLGSKEEEELSKAFPGPFWVLGIPKKVEPFPYVIDPDDPEVTKVADLIASNGYGELLGTAEKIKDLSMLDERMKDKGKFGDQRYEFVRDVHQVGCVPHIAFGMGVERLIRWLLNIPHVRDAIPFPRIFRRPVAP